MAPNGTFLMNNWYVAAWDHELIDAKLLARTILEQAKGISDEALKAARHDAVKPVLDKAVKAPLIVLVRAARFSVQQQPPAIARQTSAGFHANH